ncbi:GAF and ANTAR domain-containing protein [Nocardioides sp. J2M5]|uniref:GAF and ANTAR domain-containing protein n=1 Tax=Nocardioides palaemonis TaxID=2829810 RepID=UPI001BA77C44|nr:GAF and ANTAR domain-containing protein [Nocardioides palaemonis]MBS2938359.1 GAF and ANTAR domain-containing protein [Nocardioides palaemonis]
MDRQTFNQQLAEAARGLAAQRVTADTLQRAVEMATDLIDVCDLAGVCTVERGGVTTRAATSPDVALLDEMQYDLGDGPCLDELRTTDVCVIDDLTSGAPWPRWAARTVELTGVRSYMGFRLYVDRTTLGALNLYSRIPDAFTEDDRLDGLVIAAHAAVGLSAAATRDQMHTAMRSRQLIGEATGILRERYRLTSSQAFEVLKRISSQQNMKLFAVAQHVLDTGELPTDE